MFCYIKIKIDQGGQLKILKSDFKQGLKIGLLSLEKFNETIRHFLPFCINNSQFVNEI